MNNITDHPISSSLAKQSIDLHPSKNIALIIAYDGTEFFGWQKTAAGPNIESTLQKILEQILQHPIVLQAASRTDRGVHALGQVVQFTTTKNIPSLVSLNALLPPTIRVQEVLEKSLDFHPTLDAIGKEYHYWICQGPVQLPQHRHFSWHCHYPLDLAAMQEAAHYFEGLHDFSSICNRRKNETYVHTRRHVQQIRVKQEEGRICITVKGDKFLYKMVRNLVGLLVMTGRHKINPPDIVSILEAKDRKHMGPTAPSHGLTLYKVFL